MRSFGVVAVCVLWVAGAFLALVACGLLLDFDGLVLSVFVSGCFMAPDFGLPGHGLRVSCLGWLFAGVALIC